MSARPLSSHNLQNYPRIKIDRGTVIKPCIADHAATNQFIDRPTSGWKKILRDIWHEGIPFILRYFSNLREPQSPNSYHKYLIKAVKYIALLMLHIHQVYLHIYGYFYPYSLMSLDEICDEFSRCPKWSESVIRAFAWHPNYDRCALAICNDYVYVYQGPTRIRVLRHNHQRKIVDLAWHPIDKEILVVGTQTNIIIWRVSETHGRLTGYKESPCSSNFTYLAPGVHLLARSNGLSGSMMHPNSNLPHENGISRTANPEFTLLDQVLPPPIISLQFDRDGEKLYAASPNSSRIAVLNMTLLMGSDSKLSNAQGAKHIEYIGRFGAGVTKVLWSPGKNRLATATTFSLLRVFEPFKWTCNKWSIQGGAIQDMVWSRPTGRMLLLANKSEPYLYTLPFLDQPQQGDVGGNKSLMRALDLTATRSEFSAVVGGLVQSFAWDSNGKRLAISFKDNPDSILLYRTAERPTVEFHQLGIIQSDNGSIPLLMDFHDRYKNGALLTICWSDGNCQHVPLVFLPQEQARDGHQRNERHGHDSMPAANGPNSPPKTPRSLTNFCHVSGTTSISSYPSSLMPINKVQHQSTLFSISARNPLTDDSDDTTSHTKDD